LQLWLKLASVYFPHITRSHIGHKYLVETGTAVNMMNLTKVCIFQSIYYDKKTFDFGIDTKNNANHNTTYMEWL